MLMIALGVIRIRAAHNRATQEEIQETEMAWDDSALNIIVNPMEVSVIHYSKQILLLKNQTGAESRIEYMKIQIK